MTNSPDACTYLIIIHICACNFMHVYDVYRLLRMSFMWQVVSIQQSHRGLLVTLCLFVRLETKLFPDN